MLIWANVLPAQGLIRPKRAWCPSCYEEWRVSGQVINDPLLWALEVVTICPRHLRRLQMFCPYPDCQRAQFHFASKYQPGWCTRCCRWLGDFKSQRIEGQPSLETEEIAYQGWIYRMMGELFISAPNQSIIPQRSNVTTSFIHCVDNLTGGNLLAFSQKMEVTFKSVWDWTRGRSIPTLRSLLNVCFRCGVSPLSFVMGDKNQIKFSQINAGFKVTATCSSKHQFRKIDLEYVQNALESILQNPETPPPSMCKVAEQLGYALGTLQRRFPDHCKTISARYLHFQSQKRQMSIQRHCEEVRQAVLILHAQGCYPSLRQVRKILRNSSILKDPNVHGAWREILKELGYK
jgi:TniQ